MTRPVKRRILKGLALLCAFAGYPASAQTPQLIEPGNVITGAASEQDRPVLYYLVGESGSTITARLEAPGKASIVLFTPHGEEMLAAEGEGEVSLEAILPLTDVFVLAVARAETSEPYRLTLSATQPDMVMALFSSRVGYAESFSAGIWEWICWVDPGFQKKILAPEFEVTQSLGRGGRFYVQLRNLQANKEEKTIVINTVEDSRLDVNFIGPEVPWSEGIITPFWFNYSQKRPNGSPIYVHGENFRYQGYYCQ